MYALNLILLTPLKTLLHVLFHTVMFFDSFNKLDKKDVGELITESSKKLCSLDPMPTPLVLECSDVLLPSITK